MRLAVHYTRPNTVNTGTRQVVKYGNAGTKTATNTNTNTRTKVQYTDSSKEQPVKNSRVKVNYGDEGTNTKPSNRVAVGYSAAGSTVNPFSTGNNLNAKA